MLESLNCDACGAPLGEDLVCMYCGMRHVKKEPDGPNVVINITNNFNGQSPNIPTGTSTQETTSTADSSTETAPIEETPSKPKKITYDTKGVEEDPTPAVPSYLSIEAIVGYVGCGLGVIGFISCNVILALLGAGCCFMSMKMRKDVNE